MRIVPGRGPRRTAAVKSGTTIARENANATTEGASVVAAYWSGRPTALMAA